MFRQLTGSLVFTGFAVVMAGCSSSPEMTTTTTTTTTLPDTPAGATASANEACSWEGKFLNGNGSWATDYKDTQKVSIYADGADQRDSTRYYSFATHADNQYAFVGSYASKTTQWQSVDALGLPQVIAVEKDCKAINPNY